jgi:pimeloyl-ACP methyl ester carboxylesterase
MNYAYAKAIRWPSMGGYVALAFAELYPEYVKGLVLLNSTARADSENRKVSRRLEQ